MPRGFGGYLVAHMAGGFPAWLGPSGPCSRACAAYQRLLRLRQNLQTFLDAIAMTKEKMIAA